MSDQPVPGKVYRLTGGASEPSIQRGDSWDASEVKEKLLPTKNTKAKTRDIASPYETYASNGWEWRVLKHYQNPANEAKNPYARVFCAVRSPMTWSPMTYGKWEYGDTYCREIPGYTYG